MFRWGIIFLVIALIAAALGFGGLAGTAAWAAKIVFVVGIILFPGSACLQGVDVHSKRNIPSTK